MSEVVTSIFNKNSLLYGSSFQAPLKGLDCVERKGEEVTAETQKPAETPIKAVREK